ncbi:MAG: hypothetical protein ACR652_02835 [Methylocystis sp.]|uniref:hypothetical protein n=1 Tax=Methylocystis sp. TaxID=1911079 RepID=UPI003DA63568
MSDCIALSRYDFTGDCDDVGGASEEVRRVLNNMLAEESAITEHRLEPSSPIVRKQTSFVARTEASAGSLLGLATASSHLKNVFISSLYQALCEENTFTSIPNLHAYLVHVDAFTHPAATISSTLVRTNQSLINPAVAKLVREGMQLAALHRPGPTSSSLAKVAERLTDKEVTDYVQDRFEGMLSVLADEQLYAGQTEYVIARADGFLDQVDFEIRDRIPVAPKKFNALSSFLHQGLVSFLLNGGKVEGGWGKLVFRTPNILMVLAGSKPDTPKKGRRAAVSFS